jgi:hypothetical protein
MPALPETGQAPYLQEKQALYLQDKKATGKELAEGEAHQRPLFISAALTCYTAMRC